MSYPLRFGSIDLSPDAQIGDVEYLVYGLRFGKPVPVTSVVESWLLDGAFERVDRHDNRDQSLLIGMRAADSAVLAAAGEALFVEAQKAGNELVFAAPDGYGAPTVFDVQWADLGFADDSNTWDLDELRGWRTYTLAIRALPFGRSETATTIGSAFVADSEVIADDCESTTGWSVYRSGQTATITVDSTAGYFSTGTGAVKFAILPEVYVGTASFVDPDGNAKFRTAIRKTGLSIDASGGGYFMFRFRSNAGYSIDVAHPNTIFYLTTLGGGRQVATLVSATSLGDGFTKYALLVPDASTITGFEFEGFVIGTGFSYGAKPPNPGLWFDSLGLAAGATENQAARTLAIGGSARSDGSFEISAPVGLGDVVLYTCPDLGDGFRPDLRRYTSAGTPVADANAINASYIPANTGQFEAPANIYRAGAYAVLARVRSTATLTPTLSIAATTVLEGTAIGQTYTVDSGTITVADMTDYHIVRVGVLDLPPHKVASAADAVIRFVLNGASTIHVDEVAVFPLEDATLTWLECGSGAPSAVVASRVWIDAPSASLPLGQILIGNDANRADARYVRPKSKGRHLLYPGQNLAYLLASAAGGAEMATTYFKHWHTWAAEDG